MSVQTQSMNQTPFSRIIVLVFLFTLSASLITDNWISIIDNRLGVTPYELVREYKRLGVFYENDG